MLRNLVLPTVLGILAGAAQAINFPFEDLDLTEENFEVGQGGYRDVYFGNAKKYNGTTAECRAFPKSDDWPTPEEWAKLGEFLEGALLKPLPPTAVCYEGHDRYNQAKCRDIRSNSGSNRFFIDDPLTVLTAWPQGNTCPLEVKPNTTCTQGGYPEYVVNVTEVWQIQTAVNFARNKNIRLVIKNTGHDFLGRSTGAGALSIWTHFLKQFEFLPEYTIGQYTGPAARVGAGLESWEMYNFMDEYNVTFVTPGRYTVGVYGGWFQGGGHNALASWYGMGADQILSLQVVTAEGKFVTASPEENIDLFYALRGGGPGTYGIVTSAVVKAHPRVTVRNAPLSFGTNENVTAEAFWSAVNAYHWYGQYIVLSGGTSYNYVTYTGNNSFTFTADNEFPDLSDEEISSFLTPLWDSIREHGVPLKDISVGPTSNWAPSSNGGTGDAPGNQRFASRLFPRQIWEDKAHFTKVMAAVREIVEATYTFHGIFMAPSEDIAGWPGSNSGLNPAFRNTFMHADIFYAGDISKTEPFNAVMNKLREVTADGGGAYINESDVEEPNWQTSYFGNKYSELLKIKKARDPWNLFWAPSTVGSEGWAVRKAEDDPFPSQNGRLCQVAAAA
ncbi:hypothetical protein jhhlp_008329 [Lomentospora prolificans]|uniref:FAD-binding PCMH-type domain-containing protein n=1 Tax=Lomentospora prolificans TaxID=41688 RepID=A0A2N3MXR3_9PEZI|nr:hypothetical protein jhhlp_008329 [Lomentospora prolificans]